MNAREHIYLFTNWPSILVSWASVLGMKTPLERERIRQETEARGLNIVKIKWEAYKSLKNGGTFYIGDKGLYKSVRTRLKRMTDTEQLSRFRLLVDK